MTLKAPSQNQSSPSNDSTKRCPVCRRILPVTIFYPSRCSPDGLYYSCQDCSREHNRNQYRRKVGHIRHHSRSISAPFIFSLALQNRYVLNLALKSPSFPCLGLHIHDRSRLLISYSFLDGLYAFSVRSVDGIIMWQISGRNLDDFKSIVLKQLTKCNIRLEESEVTLLEALSQIYIY